MNNSKNIINQRGALLVLTMIMLLVISMLGISTVNTTGMEMQMAVNNHSQLRAFEAAEFTLSRIENTIRNSRVSEHSILNNTDSCNEICFNPSCNGGYCFEGASPGDWENCSLNAPVKELYNSAAFWENGGGSHLTIAVPDSDFTAQYYIEFRCYTPLDFSLPMENTNLARLFRITAFISSNDSKARTLLRSTIPLSPTTSPVAAFEHRSSWEMLDIQF